MLLDLGSFGDGFPLYPEASVIGSWDVLHSCFDLCDDSGGYIENVRGRIQGGRMKYLLLLLLCGCSVRAEIDIWKPERAEKKEIPQRSDRW